MSIKFARFLCIAALTLSSCGTDLTSIADHQRVASFKDFAAMESKFQGLETPPTIENCEQECQERRQEFRYVVYVGKQIYCYWDMKRSETGTDFESLATSLEQQITNQTTLPAYYRTLRRWAAAFHDGHVNVMMNSDVSEMEVFTSNVRFEVLHAGTPTETILVAETKDVEGLKAGDVVTKIMGQPASQYLDSLEENRSGSTRRMRRFFAARLISDVIGSDLAGDAIAIDVRKPDGTESSVKIPRKAEITAKPEEGKEPPVTSGVELIKVAILPGGVGYIRLDGFMGEQSFFLIDQAMNRVAGTKGLLIDLRVNGGGDQSGNNIINRLIEAPVTRYKVSERMSDFLLHDRPELFQNPWTIGNPFAEWRDLKVDPAEINLRYLKKPVVALTSNYCFSACDTFASALKVNKLATIVGEATGGGTGTPLVFDLPKSGLKFRYSVVRGHTAADGVIEGNGTEPDISLAPTIEERIKGKDEQLAKAIDIVLSKIQGQSSEIGRSTQAQSGAEQVMQGFGAPLKQGFDMSPTARESRDLESLTSSDRIL